MKCRAGRCYLRVRGCGTTSISYLLRPANYYRLFCYLTLVAILSGRCELISAMDSPHSGLFLLLASLQGIHWVSAYY